MAAPSQLLDSVDGPDLGEELGIANALESVRNLREGNILTQDDLDTRIQTAKQIITFLDSTTFMSWPDRYDDQVFVINELQNLAYHDADAGGVQDIAQWCVRQYLYLLNQSRDESVDSLRGMSSLYQYSKPTDRYEGLGQAWLLRAQSTLARIHRREGSPSSVTSSGHTPSSGGGLSYTSSDEAREAERAAVEADARAGTVDYVEARGMLLPATEYLRRAVAAAERTGRLNGELLSIAAEAQMSLGNVSYSHHSEHYFLQAVLYLQTASRMMGFLLSPYLQSYLDDFGRLME